MEYEAEAVRLMADENRSRRVNEIFSLTSYFKYSA